MVLLTIAALIGGIAYGVLGFDFSLVTFLTSHTDLVLYILMFCVGISIGTQKGVLQRLRQNQLAIVLVPTGVIVASLLGGVHLRMDNTDASVTQHGDHQRHGVV